MKTKYTFLVIVAAIIFIYGYVLNPADDQVKDGHVSAAEDISSKEDVVVVEEVEVVLEAETSVAPQETIQQGDVTAPIIFNIEVSDVTPTQATVTWSTDESTLSFVRFGTDDVEDVGRNEILATSHSVSLTGLTASTMYYFQISATDISDNTAISAGQAFTTSPGVEDTIIPLLLDITASDITPTEATITWRTSEDATSKMYYSKSTPLDIETAGSFEATVPKSDHEYKLSGLLPNTRYYFILEGADAAGNKGIAIENSFRTLDD